MSSSVSIMSATRALIRGAVGSETTAATWRSTGWPMRAILRMAMGANMCARMALVKPWAPASLSRGCVVYPPRVSVGRNACAARFALKPATAGDRRGARLVQVLVRDNNVDQALRALKKKLQREGVFREMKIRRNYEKPSERRARERAEAVRRYRKLLRKRMEREGY